MGRTMTRLRKAAALAALAALTVTACGAETTTMPGPTTTTDQSPADWYAKNQTDVDRIGEALNTMAAVADAGDLDGMTQACTDLGLAALTAQHLPPMPDAVADAAWQQALHLYGNAADACVIGELDETADILKEATRNMNDATEAIS